MKVEIKYSFEAGSARPFRATTWIGNSCIAGISEFSFDEAKQDLLKDVRVIIEKTPTIIPEPEEVEL